MTKPKSISKRGTNAKSRANLKPFKPGQSGNSAGRPKKLVTEIEHQMRAIGMEPSPARAHRGCTRMEAICRDAWGYVENGLATAADKGAMPDRFICRMFVELRDMTWGKPKQTINVQTGSTGNEDLSDGQLKQKMLTLMDAMKEASK